jgi:hypothetical protein
LPESVRGEFGSETDPIWADEAIEFLKQPRDLPFLLVVALTNPHDICHWIIDRIPAVEEPQQADLPPLPSNFEPEQNNLAANPDYRGELQKHRDLLMAWMEETADNFGCQSAGGH